MCTIRVAITARRPRRPTVRLSDVEAGRCTEVRRLWDRDPADPRDLEPIGFFGAKAELRPEPRIAERHDPIPTVVSRVGRVQQIAEPVLLGGDNPRCSPFE